MPSDETEITGFRAHFRNPKGFLGRIAGLLMVMSNRRVNRFAVEMLDVQPRDHALEIGFGPGACIAMLAERPTDGKVAGVDPSSTMIAQAGARNRAAVRSGRVELKVGSVSAIPYPDGSFDKVCSVNNIYFWPSRADDLREIRRVLKDGGVVALAFRIEPNPSSPHACRASIPKRPSVFLPLRGFGTRGPRCERPRPGRRPASSRRSKEIALIESGRVSKIRIHLAPPRVRDFRGFYTSLAAGPGEYGYRNTI